MKFLNFLKSLVIKQNESTRLKNDEYLEYGQECTSKMSTPTLEPIEIPFEIVSVTITPNCYNTWSEFCTDHTDAFCSLISNSKVRNVLFYNNKDCDFIRYSADDLWAGNYVEGAELEASQFDIDFKHEKCNQYEEINIGIGLYSLHTNNNRFDYSNEYVKNFIICIRTNGQSNFIKLDNENKSNSRFINLLRFKKVFDNWNLEFISEAYQTVEDYISINFNENDKPATNSV
jgi:hypothetical protein